MYKLYIYTYNINRVRTPHLVEVFIYIEEHSSSFFIKKHITELYVVIIYTISFFFSIKEYFSFDRVVCKI